MKKKKTTTKTKKEEEERKKEKTKVRCVRAHLLSHLICDARNRRGLNTIKPAHELRRPKG